MFDWLARWKNIEWNTKKKKKTPLPTPLPTPHQSKGKMCRCVQMEDK